MVAAPSPAPRVVRFGPYELDRQSGELRKDRRRVGLQDQPLQVLTVLLERPGELVTREELRQRLWPADTFVDFEHGLNAAVKRLRDALGDSAEAPRFVETIPRRGYRFIAPVGTDGGAQPVPPAAGDAAGSVEPGLMPTRAADRVAPTSRRLTLPAVATLAGIGLAAYMVYRVRWPAPGPDQPPPVLTRLTFDDGVQDLPAWAPDGRFLAYTANRAGNFDIWVQPAGGGDAVQVTRHPAYDGDPEWSPDGSRIVFRSDRYGGGLFVVPALGGYERKIAGVAYRPRWSRDGKEVLFAGGPPRFPAPIYRVALDGGAPRAVHPRFVEGFFSVPGIAWHPDGQRVSFWGFRKEDWSLETGKGEWSFWTAPLQGGTPVRSERTPEVERRLKTLGFEYWGEFTWAPSGAAVYFVGASRDIRSVWRVGVDPATLRWVGGPDQLTTGPDNSPGISLTADGTRLAFSVATENTRLWSFPFDAVRGKLIGEGQPLTPAGMDALFADVTRDGKMLAYVAWRPGDRVQHRELRVKSLETGSERVLVSGRGLHLPRWAPDGRRLAYGVVQADGELSFVVETDSGASRELVTPHNPALCPAYDWSADGEWLLGTYPAPDGDQLPRAIYFFPLSAAPRAERAARLVTARAGWTLFQTRLSPEGRWIAFLAVRDGEMGKTATIQVVASTAGGEWKPIVDGQGWVDKPRWSPDGRTIYYVAQQNGLFDAWGIRFNPSRGEAVGRPFRLTEIAATSRVRVSPDIGVAEMGIGGNRLVLALLERSSNIWMLENLAP